MIGLLKMIGSSEPCRVPPQWRQEPKVLEPMLDRDATREERLEYAVALVMCCGYSASAASRMAELPRSTVKYAVMQERSAIGDAL